MKSPFPGMDPYIEACGLWEDFHDRLISAIADAVGEALPDRYVARLGERTYIVVEPSNKEREIEHRSQADIAVALTSQRTDSATSSASVAVATATQEEPVWMTAMVSTDYRETFIEIREARSERRLVTTIEVLSPSNKRPGTLGWRLYRRKRQAHLQGLANLVEIDLVRRGRRMPMEEEWPEAPYYILVGRKEGAPRCRVWPAHFTRPLPSIPVPLLPADPDVQLNLQPLVDGAYARSRYWTDIDYAIPLRPRLSKADVTWLAQRLESVQSQGL